MECIRRGDTGPIVEILQLALARAGYMNGPPDGLFGPHTEAALLRMQNACGLPPTGKADAAVWYLLEHYVAGARRHTVQAGESLWSISAAYGTPLRAIEAANPALPTLSLRPGAIITVPLQNATVPGNVTYCTFLLGLLIGGLTMRFPCLTAEEYGKSVCGRPLFLLSAGNGPKELFACAGLGANEWLNTAVLLRFTEDYLTAVINGSRIAGEDAKTLFDRTKLLIAPAANPDGLDIASGAARSGAAFEAAMRATHSHPEVPFPVGWKANAQGVDLTLQFPAAWDKTRAREAARGYTSPAPFGFAGPSPLSAPEARTLYELTQKHRFKLALCYASPGNTICGRYKDHFPPESGRIAAALSDASGYPLSGCDDDTCEGDFRAWFIARYNRPAYTIKTGSGNTPVSVEEFDAVYAANKPLLTAALRETAGV